MRHGLLNMAVHRRNNLAELFFHRVISLPSVTQQGYYHTLLEALAADGTAAALDVLVVPGHEPGISLTNLISGSFMPALDETSIAPIFQANLGWCTQGPNTNIDSLFNLSTSGGKYSRDSAMVAMWNRTVNASSAALWRTDADVSCELWPSSSGFCFTLANSTTERSVANTNSSGFFLTNRASSSSYTVRRNNSLLATYSAAGDASVAPENAKLVIGYGTFQIAAYAIGSALTTGQQTTLYNSLNTYLTAILPATIWNPYDLRVGPLTLSNGNLTVTTNSHINADSTDNMIRSNVAVNSGKRYVEFTLTIPDAAHANNPLVGLASNRLNITSGSPSNSFAYVVFAGGVIKYFSSDFGSGTQVMPAVWVTGDTIAMAVDFDAQLIWWKNITQATNWNDSGAANPATGVGGKTITNFMADNPAPIFLLADMVGSGAGIIIGQAIRLNAGASAYVGTVPSGFSNWAAAVAA